MMKFPRFALLLFVGWPLLRAAEPTDLGQDLAYLRVHSLADEQAVIGNLTRTGKPLVLDLRYATASDESLTTFRSTLSSRLAGATLFILVSPATPTTLAAAVAGELTLGPVGTLPAPKVVVQINPDTDRHAYDALAAGKPLAELIAGRIEKDRYDEASLMKDFKNGNTSPEPPPRPGVNAAKPSAGEVTPILVDRVLQRAVNLHQALLALQRPTPPKR